jgi:hypothetical protein
LEGRKTDRSRGKRREGGLQVKKDKRGTIPMKEGTKGKRQGKGGNQKRRVSEGRGTTPSKG